MYFIKIYFYNREFFSTPVLQEANAKQIYSGQLFLILKETDQTICIIEELSSVTYNIF